MRRLYFAFVGAVSGLLLYAGATGNFGIIPDLPFDLPIRRHSSPPAETLAAPMLLPDESGPTGVTAGQFVQYLQQNGARLSWERGADQQSWVMRYTMHNELTDEDYSGAGRLKFVRDASSVGVSGPATVFSCWAEDGQEFTLFQSYSTVLSITSAIRQGQ